MNNQSFAILEYNELLALVRRRAQTPMGRARVEALQPLGGPADLRHSLAALAECVELRSRGVVWSFSELSDPSGAALRTGHVSASDHHG